MVNPIIPTSAIFSAFAFPHPCALFSPHVAATKLWLLITTLFLALSTQAQDITRASLDPINTASDEILIKGQISPNQWQPTTVRINYGLEKYFVPEGRGNPRGKLTVQASIAPDGTALIKQVYIDGKPYADVMRSEPK